MKKIKDLRIKAEDYRKKVSTYCADLSYETPLYGAEQKTKIKEWLQGHGDIIKEILKLRIQIQKTNLYTSVTIELGGVQVTKTIAEWIHRRKDLAELERSIYSSLGDRGLREGTIVSSTQEKIEAKIRRYFDPSERDTFIELYRGEPSKIDSTLEVINAVTDLQE